MKTLKEAILEITYETKKFPEEAFQIIIENEEEAKPYFYEALRLVIREKEDLDENYQLHFYALFFMGQFKDKSAFRLIMEMVSQSDEVVEYLIGDTVTSDLKDMLYLTFDGDYELLKHAILNPDINEFVKEAMLSAMGQLYLDGRVDEEEWKPLLKKLIHQEEEFGDYFSTMLLGIVCRSHMVELLPDIRFLFEENLVDGSVFGYYDSCVDMMFEYSEHGREFCVDSMTASTCLKGWGFFEEEEIDTKEVDVEKLYKKMQRHENRLNQKQKIGRNAPCPCGSGKKYKQCCINNTKDKESWIESESEQQKWLCNYPKLETQKEEGKIYLEDFFDKESIEIDRLLYLGLMDRSDFIWDKVKEDNVNARKKAYLWEAFSKYMEKVEKESIKSFKEYDEKYSIHYTCCEWMGQLKELLKMNDAEFSTVHAEYNKRNIM